MTSIEHRLFQQPWPEGEYRLFQLGFVVDDVLATAARWADVLGVGPFHVLPPIETPCTYHGTASAVEVQIGVAQAGPGADRADPATLRSPERLPRPGRQG